MKNLIIFLLLLSITPWFLTLIIGKPALRADNSQPSWPQKISTNISFYTSAEFIFFNGDGRPGYGTGDHGVFLLSFLPLIFIGIYHGHKKLLSWLVGGLIIASLFSSAPGLPYALLYLPALSIFAAIGFKQLAAHKVFLRLNIIWMLYESLRLYHVILVHKPFSL